MSAPLVRLSRRSVAALSVTAALSLTLAACGGGSDPSTVSAPPVTSSPAAGGAVDAAHNDADVAFIADMAPHHSGALAMSALAPTRAESPAVKALAARIGQAQGPEIALMATMAKTWQVDPSTAGGDMGGMGADDAQALAALSGKEFDTQFLTRMVQHHGGALVMARKELTDGDNPQAKDLAQRIVAAQDAEIAEMRGLLATA